MTDRSDSFFADLEGMARNSWSVNDAAEYANELHLWKQDSLAPLKPLYGEGDKFARDMQKTLGLLETSIDEYLGFIVVAVGDTSAILGGSKEKFGRGEEDNVNTVPDINTPDGPGGGRR
ncbi:hypothetical protein Q8791_25740 [Nocardiopsis sp. CT-R113]|uniref:Uncharacterized protein n=1 Tax=Nocardiopsis codii TaxID=3065942 RepID=A0ABU7KEG0_9ACTN|nr:hypothetical protein [Nocardiopsis sp. CT-R113]MEE2040625.1 hypothetical protein [Nocardiopsis sp. CT-R113]